jgi:hypothetical protein
MNDSLSVARMVAGIKAICFSVLTYQGYSRCAHRKCLHPMGAGNQALFFSKRDFFLILAHYLYSIAG